jgi:hypothetical protein
MGAFRGSALMLLAALYGVSTSIAAADTAAAAHVAANAFIQSCMQLAGNPVGLRDWIAAQAMTRAPPSVSEQYPGGRAGQVFGIRSAAGALLIVSHDDGGCSMVLEHADGAALRQTFEALMTGAHATCKITHDEEDNPRSHLHNRAYEIVNRESTRKWRVVITTAEQGSGPFQAILTAYALSLPQGYERGFREFLARGTGGISASSARFTTS